MLENLVFGPFRLLGGGPILSFLLPLEEEIGDIDLNAIDLKKLINTFNRRSFPVCHAVSPVVRELSWTFIVLFLFVLLPDRESIFGNFG